MKEFKICGWILGPWVGDLDERCTLCPSLVPHDLALLF